MLPQVVLNAGGASVEVRNRSCGALTGSRLPGLLGRVPVESVILERHATWKKWGFKTETETLMVCTFVDNIQRKKAPAAATKKNKNTSTRTCNDFDNIHQEKGARSRCKQTRNLTFSFAQGMGEPIFNCTREGAGPI